MDIRYSPGEREYRQRLRAWLETNLAAEMREIAGRQAWAGETEEERILLRDWQRRLHEAGFVGSHWPPEFGGRGGSPLEPLILREELEDAGAPPVIGIVGLQMVGPTLMQYGTPEQKAFHLPRTLTAETVWCQGYSEPGSGSDLASLQTRAIRDGEYFVVNGQKIWTSNAHYADWMFLLARTDAAAARHKGISYLLLDMRTGGITVRPLKMMTGDDGFNEVFFDNVRIPVTNLVGRLNGGWEVANATLAHERVMLGSPSASMRLYERLVELARSTSRHGRPAIEDPAIRRRIARLKMEVEAARWLGCRNLTRLLRGEDVMIGASIAKLFGTELNYRLTALALEILGAYGPLYRGSRNVRDGAMWPYEHMFALGMIIGGGTSQIQRNIIAERGLGMPRP